MVHPLVRTLVFTALVPATVAVLIPSAILRGAPRLEHGPLEAAGWAALAVGFAGYSWCAGLFSFIGRGSPAPVDPPTRLVVRGPYTLVRNPMYVSVLFLVAGQAILARSAALAAYAVVLWCFFALFVVNFEEPSLLRRFGDEYESYRRRVPRWLPRMRRAPPRPS